MRIIIKINNAEAGARAFSVPDIENQFSKLHMTTLSDERKETADIRIIIHDPVTQFEPLLGFSIKSYLGGKPTLFNASKNSNIIFKITPELTETELTTLNNIETYGKRFTWLQETAHKLKFVKMNSDIFSSNLELIDSSMPKIVSEIVLSKTFNGKNKITDIAADLKENNPCNYKIDLNPNFYEYKIKRLLVDAALGMKAGKLWTGNFSATGGYIAVKQDGELVCYHIYNWNDFQNYLFNHTKIDYPDSSPNRCDFGRILTAEEVSETDGTFIKINFQIRFI